MLNQLRLLSAKLRSGTVRFYTGKLDDFYRTMNECEVPYVVLRWSENVPQSPSEEAGYTDDIDHLVGDNSVNQILQIASRFRGPVKCDYYSASGQKGSSYRGYPYFPPSLANKILAERKLDQRGFYRPHPEHEFLSFAYHLCYHKGTRSRLPTGFEQESKPDSGTSKDYGAELRRLAKRTETKTVPAHLNLLTIHNLLKEYGWSMPLDLMMRWPDQHEFLVSLQEYETRRKQDIAARIQDITVFVLREDCSNPEMEEIARRLIAERFEILHEIRLDTDQQRRLVNQTRGGNWVEKYCNREVLPTVVYVCRNAPSPGPLPIKISNKKLASKYPHLANTDVLIKRVVRQQINKNFPAEFTRVAIHASDNAMEAVEFLEALNGDESVHDQTMIVNLLRGETHR